jgi:glycerol-3-phosphate dehydrogenase
VRDHEVEIDKLSGLISIMGGKWTTYRIMAKDTIDKTEEILRGSVSACPTETQKLVGSEDWTPDYYKIVMKHAKIQEYIAKRLSNKYGTKALDILALIQKDGTLRLPVVDGSPILRAEIVYAAINEMGMTLKDVFARRLGLELIDWDRTYEAIDTTANLLQEVFWWSEEDKLRYVEEYKNEILKFKKTAGLDMPPIPQA